VNVSARARGSPSQARGSPPQQRPSDVAAGRFHPRRTSRPGQRGALCWRGASCAGLAAEKEPLARARLGVPPSSSSIGKSISSDASNREIGSASLLAMVANCLRLGSEGEARASNGGGVGRPSHGAGACRECWRIDGAGVKSRGKARGGDTGAREAASGARPANCECQSSALGARLTYCECQQSAWHRIKNAMEYCRVARLFWRASS
jgi:hypothetical protein